MDPKKNRYATFNLSDEAIEAIQKRFAGQPAQGQASPRQAWTKAQNYISLLEPEDLAIHAYTLWQRSMQIAKRKRGDHRNLRTLESIQAKIYEEEEHYAEIVDFYRNAKIYHEKKRLMIKAIYRLSNLLYYQVQMYVLTGLISGFMLSCQRYCDALDFRLPLLVAFQCAVEKMSDRAERDEKDIPSEEARIEQVLQKHKILS